LLRRIKVGAEPYESGFIGFKKATGGATVAKRFDFDAGGVLRSGH